MAETDGTTTRPTMDVLLSQRASTKKDEPESKAQETPQKANVAGEKADVSDQKALKADESEKKAASEDEKTVPLKALHEARLKNRELKSEVQKLREELEALKKGEAPSETTYWDEGKKMATPTDEIPEWYVKDRFIKSVNEVRRERKDADEVFEAFDKLCDADDQARVPGQVSLWDRAYSSADPGHFITEYVEQTKIQEKYGSDPKTMKEKIRAELEKEVSESVAQKFKTKNNSKDQLPTDIVGSRAAGGNETPYNRPTATDLFDRRRKQFFKKVIGGNS